MPSTANVNARSKIEVPIKCSIRGNFVISFDWIRLIIAQAGFLLYKAKSPERIDAYENWYTTHLAAFVFFLGTFAGNWSSKRERALFLAVHGRLAGDAFIFVQFHVRCFTVLESTQAEEEATRKAGKAEGLDCKRQMAEVSSARGGDSLRIREMQVSIFGVLSTKAVDGDLQPRYRVMMLSEAGSRSPNIPVPDGRFSVSLRRRPGLEGVMAFQTALLGVINLWETEWAEILDKADDCVRFQLSQTMDAKRIQEWMLDVDFTKSRVYFTVLQILRIFGEYISTVSEDLRSLNSLFLEPEKGLPFCMPSPDETDCIESN